MGWRVSREQRLAKAKEMGYNFDNRMTGQSTAIVLSVISKALANPNTPYKMYDHTANVHSVRNNMDVARRLIREMNLDGFYFNSTNNSVVFTLNSDGLVDIGMNNPIDPRSDGPYINVSLFLTLWMRIKILFSKSFYIKGKLNKDLRFKDLEVTIKR